MPRLRVTLQGEPPRILTKREREVLVLVAQGYTSREIADRLFVTVRTVWDHRSSILRKLGARNLADLTRYAIREGLVEA